MATILVLLVLVLVLGLLLRKVIRDKKSGGCSGCPGGCSGCSHACHSNH